MYLLMSCLCECRDIFYFWQSSSLRLNVSGWKYSHSLWCFEHLAHPFASESMLCRMWSYSYFYWERDWSSMIVECLFLFWKQDQKAHEAIFKVLNLQGFVNKLSAIIFCDLIWDSFLFWFPFSAVWPRNLLWKNGHPGLNCVTSCINPWVWLKPLSRVGSFFG